MEIKGLIPAMATPMHADGSLNLDGVKPLVDKLLAMGAYGVFAVGSMGEAASLIGSPFSRPSGVAATSRPAGMFDVFEAMPV